MAVPPSDGPMTMLRQGRVDEAESACRARVARGDGDADTHYVLGRIAMQRGDEHAAEAALRRALACDPAHDAARYRLAQVAIGLHGAVAASEIYREWAAARPGHPVAAHLLAATSGDADCRRATPAYVRATFDEMAGDFDRVMEALAYCGPMLIDVGLARTLGEPDSARDILDAGCGTGLCAPELRPWARHLYGIDISPLMVERARETALYDRVDCGEILDLLVARPGAFDAIVMADVLVYLGMLEDVVAAVHAALRPGGAFVFTVERAAPDGPDMTLGASGRFAHQPAYLERVARDAGLRDLVLSDAPLRVEGGEPVPAVLGTARR